MKKMIAVFVLACVFNAASANNSPGLRVAVKTNAFVQPFSAAYALDAPFLWFTDIDLTNPTGTYCDVFYEITRLSSMFGGFQFSHLPYAGLNEFEYGIGVPWLYQTIYSDLPRF
ncbi:hypothetical protein A4H97_09340 [Niastella yeongjuensis]|uniref:Uncharacterized protein n=1 Tax=Niastella yeongjuensis TaxID=354355 RepID=A0A1V9EEM0_9BACT|nr:hypothetical protein [Niastella yeongjuensis]OQP44563.1 hypothetical protein A4H97_09340 [Niastella yeongjuensis]SEO83337.1 hypothetical protein SAMN05660816_03678 [Niastella yeongjuensis]